MAKQKTPKQLLVAAAKELNKTLGLEPAIATTKTTIDELEAKLTEALGLITADDEFTDDTASVLERLMNAEAEEEEVEEAEILEEEVEEEEASEEEEVSDEEMVALIEGCSNRRELVTLTEEYEDYFWDVNVAKHGAYSDLRDAMLSVAGVKEEEPAPEPKKEPKKSKPKKEAKKKKKEEPEEAVEAKPVNAYPSRNRYVSSSHPSLRKGPTVKKN